MGYTQHHAIVVTSYENDLIFKALDEAMQLRLPVTPVIQGQVNEWHTFLIGPDGSQEGWAESNQGDTARDAFITWIDSQRFMDGSSPYKWVEVRYGDDNGHTMVTRHSDESTREKPGMLDT